MKLVFALTLALLMSIYSNANDNETIELEPFSFNGDKGEVLTFGPNISFNLSKNNPELSIGFQTSVYAQAGNYELEFIGVGSGVEYSFTNKNTRFYLDAKYSEVVYGASVGWVWDQKLGAGHQANIWGSYFLGTGFQYRKFWSQEEARLRMNGFLSVPMPLTSVDESY